MRVRIRPSDGSNVKSLKRYLLKIDLTLQGDARFESNCAAVSHLAFLVV